MNKKAALFHLILFGILGAIALFFILTAKVNVGTAEKGSWPRTFLEENYLQAEKETIKLNLQAKALGKEIAQELAFNGGFKTTPAGSSCGVVDGIPLWNFEERWCFPDPEKGVQELFQEKKQVGKAPLELQDIEDVGIQGSLFFGKGREKTVTSSIGTYTYPATFSIDLGYSFDEYKQLEQLAADLVHGCSKRKDLTSCLTERKTAGWAIGLCGEQPRELTKRTVVFCINSAYTLQGKPLQYQLGLDFTAIEPFAVETFTVKLVEPGYEVRFEQDNAVEEYVLYYTNWPLAAGKKGSYEEVFESGVSLEVQGYYKEKKSFANPATADCPAEKEAGKAYLCLEEKALVVYVLQDVRIKAEKTYVTVTSRKGSQESVIDHFKALDGSIVTSTT